MSRVPRIYIENAVCYITSRGDHEGAIFKEDGDYKAYMELLKKTKDQFKFKLFAFCLLPNHAHLLIEPDEESTISQTMHGLSSNYTKYFNGKYKSSGHLFQERYKMALVEKDPNIANMTAYINLNPKAVGVTSEPKSYQYSSYPSYLYYGGSKGSLIGIPVISIEKEVREVSTHLNGRRYEDYVNSISSEVLQNIGKELSKKPIIGSDEFVTRVKSKIESEKLKAETEKAGAGAVARNSKRFIIVSGIVIAVLGLLTFYLYSRTISFKSTLKNREVELRLGAVKAREEIKKDLNERYHADMVSYEAMTKRLEIEKKRAVELENKLKAEGAPKI